MIYRNHEITRTDTVEANSGHRLYSVSGLHTKSAATRPFLTSLDAAREWIANRIDRDAHAAARAVKDG